MRIGSAVMIFAAFCALLMGLLLAKTGYSFRSALFSIGAIVAAYYAGLWDSK